MMVVVNSVFNLVMDSLHTVLLCVPLEMMHRIEFWGQ
jgi:hypothetical protein